MSDQNLLLCKQCNGEVTPGTIYCFRHKKDPPRVGVFGESDGQLAWTSTTHCSGRRQERLLAVMLDKTTQVMVVGGVVSPDRSARIELKVTNPTDPGTTTTTYIPLTALLKAILEGIESIEAVREAR